MAEENTTTQPVTIQIPSTVKSLIEALIFGAREPLSVRQIQALYEVQGPEGSEPRKIDYDSIARLVEELNGEYTAADRPYRIVQIAGGYQFATMPAYAEWLGKLYKEQTRRKLSQSSIETLAIIAYKQPITKPEIESIRGVNCDYVLSTLLEKDMATIVGRAPTVGRPLLYGTTREFLKHFGLNDLNDLPRPREIQEILGDGQFETERRMLEAQQGLLEEKKEEEFKSRLPHIPKRKAGMDDDVKIYSKKRSKEIKLRQSEEGSEKQGEETQEGAQLTLTPEAAASIQPQEPIETGSVDSTAVSPAPVAEEKAEEPEIGSDQDQSLTDSSILAESLKYIDLTHAPAVEREDLEQTDAVTFDAEGDKPAESEAKNEDLRPEIVSAGPAEIAEDVPFAPVEDSQAAGPTLQETSVAAPEEQSAPALSLTESDASEVAQPESQEQTVADAVRTVGQASAADVEDRQTPELGRMPETAQDHHQDPSSKSRWTSWKEKIQGFIKKLFG